MASSFEPSLWYKNAVFYELYVRAFYDSNGDGHGDLRGVIEKLDYLQDLGVDCLWLLPIYPSPLKDDGYDVADFYGIHPDYGTLDDFKALIAAAHARGIRVIADLVLNHTSDQHPWFQAARRERHSPYRAYYVWSDSDQKYKEARIIFVDAETSNWTWDEVAGQYYWHRFYRFQPDLNYDNPAVQAEMLKIARFWLDLGIDGFRADAVPYLFEREGSRCENLPETHAYLKRLRAMLEAEYPGRILLCEANQWPEDVRPYFGGDPNDPSVPGDEFHLGFHFPLMPRLFMALKKGHKEDLVRILERTPPIPYNCQWCTFLRNHDELTLEMVSEEERQWMWQEYAPERRMRLNLGIRRRLAPLLDGDQRKIELANSLLFTLPGTPILYYGDEIGMGDNIWLPDRNGVRTPMQWCNAPNAGFTAPEVRPYTPPIDDPVFGYQRVNVQAQRADPGSLYHAIRRMIAARKAHPTLGWGRFEWVEVGNPAVAAYLRSDARARLLILNNLSGAAQTLHLPPHLGAIFTDLFSGQPVGSLTTLQPYAYHWLKVEVADDGPNQTAGRH
jgi:maltose alpha-D-glucosyltransferase/alpha-amylase